MRDGYKQSRRYYKRIDGKHQTICGLDEVKQIREFMERWRVNQKEVARKIGMAQTTFNKKLHQEKSIKYGTERSFSLDELLQIREVLKEMAMELQIIIEIYMTLMPDSIKAYDLQEKLKDEIWMREHDDV